jgi:polysaccharide pyruvyl transferase WcaK-like protein
MNKRANYRHTIAFLGQFSSNNFGNDSTLQAILYHFKRFQPNTEIVCISGDPEATAATHQIKAIPFAENLMKSWVPRNRTARVLRKVCIGLPSEAWRWAKSVIRLRRTDILIIPGGGLLTDAYGLLGWGPYSLFKWSLIAKVCGCKLFFVSVGAGPIYGALGKWLLRSTLSLADFRSYRDNSSVQYLESIGFRANNDPVYPDLAFSLPEDVIPYRDPKKSVRSVVGLGVMEYAGRYSVVTPSDTTYSAYLQTLAKFVEWLLIRGYDVRLLSGDVADVHTRRELKVLLTETLGLGDHIIDEQICSVNDLLGQIAATDIVVATRFHNVLLSLLCGKPVISIAFHHKCESLMSAMGLSEYCLDINCLTADRLVEKFCDLQANSEIIKPSIRAKAREFREALNEQYELIFK